MVDDDTNSLGTSSTSDGVELQEAQDETYGYVNLDNENVTYSAQQLFDLGRSYQSKGQIQEAIECYKQVVQIADAANRPDIGAKAAQHLGNVFCSTTKYQKAIEYYQKARDITPDIKANEMEAIAYQWLGYNYLQADQYGESIKYCNEAVQLASQLGNKTREFNCCLGLGRAFSSTNDFQSSEEHYLTALDVAEQLNETSLPKDAHTYQWLGYNYLQAGRFEESLKYYKMAVQLASQFSNKTREFNCCMGLGNVFSSTDDFQSSKQQSFLNALAVAEQLNEATLQRDVHTSLGQLYFKSSNYDAAVESYLKVQQISHDLGDSKEETNAYFMRARAFQELKDHEMATECYRQALSISKDMKDEEMQRKMVQGLGSEGTAYLNLASDSCRDCDYEDAVKWYEKALDIFKEISDNVMKKKTLTGLGILLFKLGNTQQAVGLLREAREFNNDKPYTGQYDVVDELGKPNLPTTSSQVPDSVLERGLGSDTFVKSQEFDSIEGEWVNSVIQEACNPSRTESLPNERLVRLERYIKEFSASYVYTHHTSSNEPFTESVRNSMTRNVKTSAYQNLLGGKNAKFNDSDGRFVDDDQEIFNFASDVSKNSSTKKPAILLKPLCCYINSIGQIACGRVRGTCFLVADMLLITNHHVYMAITGERNELQNPNMPIKVSFDYFYCDQTEHVVTVEVDEEQDPQLESSNLDYKFLRLKENDGLEDRLRLGTLVRAQPLHQGRVVIVGHPAGEEMCEETVIVVSNDTWLDKMNKRHEVCTGVHMTNEERLQSTERYEERVPYDTSLFSGTSGSPVFDLKGNIVAMHTQGYPLEVEGKKYSLMEFGVPFQAICQDMSRRNVCVEQYFPNYKLEVDEQLMDVDS